MEECNRTWKPLETYIYIYIYYCITNEDLRFTLGGVLVSICITALNHVTSSVIPFRVQGLGRSKYTFHPKSQEAT